MGIDTITTGVTYSIVFPSSPSCLSSIDLVRRTDHIKLEIADPLEREAVDEPDVGWQSSDGNFVDYSIYPFGNDDNGERVGEFEGNDGYGAQQGKKRWGQKLHNRTLSLGESRSQVQNCTVVDR